MAIKQHILPLALPQEKSFAHFLVGANQSLLNGLNALTNNAAVYLWGSSGSGCSHLLQATCLAYKKKDWYTLYLDLRHTDSLLPLLEGMLEGIQLLAVDHIDAWIGIKDKEEQLFNLFNRASQAPFAMLWAASMPPQSLACALSDYQSRLCSLLVFQVHTLEDAALAQALQEHAKQRGFILKPKLAEFIVHHYPRDLTQLLKLLDQLDCLSLQTKKPLSIAFLKKYADPPTLKLRRD